MGEEFDRAYKRGYSKGFKDGKESSRDDATRSVLTQTLQSIAITTWILIIILIMVFGLSWSLWTWADFWTYDSN